MFDVRHIVKAVDVKPTKPQFDIPGLLGEARLVGLGRVSLQVAVLHRFNRPRSKCLFLKKAIAPRLPRLQWLCPAAVFPKVVLPRLTGLTPMTL